MSDNTLKLIPASPHYVPTAVAAQEARDLLAVFFSEAAEISSKFTEEARFVDQGANWERVLCPICGTELDEAWWQKAMDAAYRTNFANLSVILPCCGAMLSLNDLQYEWPAGFARFTLEIRNPGGDLDDYQLRSLEQILGCHLRKIWAHY
jgi:hypothetical protein